MRGAATGARRLALGLAVLGLLALLLGLAVGSSGWEWPQGLWASPTSWPLVLDIRLPRTLGAWLTGALLGLAGALAQGLFRNPLADPYLLGSASGATLGVALALLGLGAGAALPVAWPQRLGLTGAAFVGALLAVLMTLALARGVQQTLRLLLAGVVVGVVLGALGALVMLFAPQLMQTLQSYMWGSTAFIDGRACALLAAVWLLSLGLGVAGSRLLDGLSLGETTARSLGLPVSGLRRLLVGVLALATAAAVAQAGLIGFVGLAAPHLVRARLQVPHAWLLVLASLMGGLLLTAADVLARGLLAPQELPVGVLTAVLGGGYLLWRLGRHSPGGAP